MKSYCNPHAECVDKVSVASGRGHTDLLLLVDGELLHVHVNDGAVHDRRGPTHDEREREGRGEGGGIF